MAVTATKNITQNKGNGTSKASKAASTSSASSTAGGGAAAAAAASAAGARFRQRKISTKQPLTIYRQKDLPSVDINSELEQSHVHHLYNGASGGVSLSGTAVQKRDLHAMETGVDKNEEDEVHLQQVINAAQQALTNESKKQGESSEAQVYIPTPDASKVWPDAYKYYGDVKYLEPDSYVKFSATVEDTVGVEYNIDEVDEEFLTKLNNGVKNQCSELEFELVCDKFEKLIEEKQPFLSMDPSNILSFKELSGYILDEYNSSGKFTSTTNYILTISLKDRLSKELQYKPFVTQFDKPNPEGTKEPRTVAKLLILFGEKIYNHWKVRKIERRGKSIVPSLKFEDPNATEKDNDNDPYICFRRREFRQARKTRRADTIGGERIRLLQKSLHRASDLVMSVCKREILKLQSLESENEIFKLRCEGKSLKRTVGVKGDDYLYYPHKRKKEIKPKPKEEETISKGSSSHNQGLQQSRKDHSHSHTPNPAATGVNAANNKSIPNIQDQTSSTQPYVKLPPSKIPDMDLVTVSLVLKEKNETIKRAVLEKLRKRREMDKGYINATDDPYEPYFNISTKEVQELSHIPYSSVAASSFHEFITSNYIDNSMKSYLDEGEKPLPLMKTFKGSTGELAPSKPFPHLQTFMESEMSTNSEGYVAQLLHNIETNNFSAYSNGYGQTIQNSSYGGQIQGELSEPIFKLRKRIGRGGMYIDRRGLFKGDVERFMDMDVDSEDNSVTPTAFPESYKCKEDSLKRLESRWRFDNDLSENEAGLERPFSLDPSKLNCISDDTQSIRFGSMLLAKSYDLLREAVQQKQQVFMQQRMRALQHQSGSSNSSNSNSNNALYSQQMKIMKQGGASNSKSPTATATANLVEQKKSSTTSA